jgi:glycosyltransferase involved in cell wall biosynthesis
MRILWVKTELLHPVDKGGRLRTYEMLRVLAAEHEVTYLCLDDASDANARELAREYAATLVTVAHTPPIKPSVRFVLDLLRNLFSRYPYAIARYRSVALEGEIRRLAASSDVVVCDFLAPAINIPRLSIPTVLFQHNVEASIWERRASVARTILARLYMRSQWRRMKRFEAKACARLDQVIAVSETDAAMFKASYGAKRVSHVQTGVTRSDPGPLVSDRDGAEIVFVGSMDWTPNVDGVLWFVDAVLPLIVARVPDVRFTIVGRTPAAAIRDLPLRHPHISVTGTIPDVRPYLRRAIVSVVPLRIGGGTRLKVYESMILGTPVVSTRIGVEGLPVVDQTHLLAADSAEQFAECVVDLLQNRDRASALAATALCYVEQNFSWASAAREFACQLQTPDKCMRSGAS